MAKIAKIGTVRIPRMALTSVALPVVGLRGAAGGGAADYWPAGTPEAIRQACMLWYDIARQGCTNETMAANPVLRDLSGNGHDAECRNFAWAGMSGIGGYDFNFGKFLLRDTAATFERSAYAFTVTSVKTTGSFLETNSATVTNPPFTVKVSGLDDAGAVLKYGSDTTSFYEMPQDGVYELPGVTSPFIGFRFDKAVEQCNITVEIMPLYPGALVADGVDDYAYVEGLPLLTKEQGYTVVAKRKYLTGIKQSCLASKRNSSLPNGAFVFELYVTNWRSDSFGHANSVSLEESDISYQTSKSYNGRFLDSGEESDNNTLNLLNLTGNFLANVALYSFLLFNRDLTTEEIEWVKTNMMQQ